jgi:flavin reductase (DIM6/NTAB) family NADH-FMN oxidoreductase RutF
VFYDAVENVHGLKHDPFKALIAPRPIGWISTIGKDGVVNLAPYSFFNAISDNPHYVMFSSLNRKDSQRNAEETGEFVCSLATWDLRDQMNKTSAAVGPEVDEMALAGLTPAPSQLVKPPRVAESPVAFECKYYQSVELPPDTGRGIYTMVIGRVVGIYIDDKAIREGMVDTAQLKPIARLGYMDYAVVDNTFTLQRPQ